MNDQLTIIVLTFNSSGIIQKCLSSIQLHGFKIIVVDNHSSDETTKIIEDNFPNLELIKLDKNVGYGRGNNVALKKVQTKYALVLNPDAFIEKESIDKILEEMEKNEKIALAGPIVLENYPAKEDEIRDIKNRIEKDISSIKDQYKERFGNIINVRFLIGACVFFRVSFFKKFGFFDENIFMYYEDDEICKRVEDNGFQNVIIDDSFAFHIGGASSKKNLRSAFRKGWHMNGWSKLYWKELRKGAIAAKKSSIRLSTKYFLLSFFSLFQFDSEKLILNIGSLCGSISYMIGLSAFKKNGESRG